MKELKKLILAFGFIAAAQAQTSFEQDAYFSNLNNFTFAALIDGIRKIFDVKIDSYAAIRKNTLSNINKNSFIKKNFVNIANKGLFI